MKTYPLLHIENKYSDKTVILANGHYPTHLLPCTVLDQSNFVVCCDGAANQYIESGKIPSVIVGDGDSLSLHHAKEFRHLIRSEADQETNDLTKAVHYCLNLGKDELYILGATGKREDHTIANISLLAEYASLANVQMITDTGIFTAISEDAILETFPGQQISIFSLEAKPLTVEHLLYPIQNRVLTNWWQATLNEAISNHFAIYTTGKVLIFRSF